MINKNEPNIWRLQTRTASEDGKSISDFCLNNKIIAIGWSLHDDTLSEISISEEEIVKLKSERDNISNFEDYSLVYKKFYKENVNTQIYKLYNEIKINDLIWMRHNGEYYLGRVGENSKWQYCADNESMKKDAGNQRTDIEWINIGGESDVPGGITTSFIRGRPIQHIWKEGIKEFSMYIYNEKTKSDKYPLPKIDNKNIIDLFYHYIDPLSCEDLLCMYLYKNYGYICIPSTNKKSTSLYECVLLNPQNGERVYIQVKCGNVNIDAEKYKTLNGKSYLFTSSGAVYNLNSATNIKVINSVELFKFALDEKNNNILPYNILKWKDVIRKMQNSK